MTGKSDSGHQVPSITPHLTMEELPYTNFNGRIVTIAGRSYLMIGPASAYLPADGIFPDGGAFPMLAKIAKKLKVAFAEEWQHVARNKSDLPQLGEPYALLFQDDGDGDVLWVQMSSQKCNWYVIQPDALPIAYPFVYYERAYFVRRIQPN